MGSVHVDAWSRVPEAQVAAVADPKPHRRIGDFSDVQGNLGGPAAKQDFSQVRGYATPAELLADPEVEAVDICLPTDLHLPMTLAALQAGKHVLVEKPMALTGEECDQMLEAAHRNDRVLMVGQVIRFWPEYATARELCRAGRLGRLRSAEFHRRCAAPAWGRWLPDRARSGGGIFDLLIHDVDYCRHLLGPPVAVSAHGVEENSLDWVSARFEYPGGATVLVGGGWYLQGGYPFSMDFSLAGDAGTLEFHSQFQKLTMYPAGGSPETPACGEANAYESEIRYFLECARANRWPECCRPEESAEAVRTMRAIQESRFRRGQRIPL
jgi:predicted dehydrogenase